MIAGKRRGKSRSGTTARVEKHPVSGRHVPPNRARDDIARREFGAGNTGHEAIAGLVDEDRALRRARSR